MKKEEEKLTNEMSVSEAIRTRKTIRSFQKKAIEPEKLDRILEAAYLAPSAGGLHWINIIVIKEEAAIHNILNRNGKYVTSKRIKAILKEKPEYLHNAAALLVVSANIDKYRKEYADLIQGTGSSKWYKLQIGELFSVNDADTAALSMTLQAHALGLGVCWIGHINELHLKKLLKLKGESLPICILVIGYPDLEGEKEIRRILEEKQRSFPEPPPASKIFFEEEYERELSRIETIEKNIRRILRQKRADMSSSGLQK